MKIQSHRSSGRHIGSIYPFGHDLPLVKFGTYIGDNIFGNPFLFDPFELYNSQAITNPNIVIFGQIGRGKSAFIKSFITRQIALGRTAWIIDPKGEYSGLCRAFGIEPLVVKNNGQFRMNPIDLKGLFKEDSMFENNGTGIISAIIEARLKRALNPVEITVIELVLNYVKKNEIRDFNIVKLARLMVDFTVEMADNLTADFDLLYDGSRQMAYCLNLVVTSELKGLFAESDHTKSSEVLSYMTKPLNVIDLSQFFNSNSLDIIMACAISWMQSYVLNKPGKNNWYFIIDEAWAVLNNFATRSWLQKLWKLSRAYGLSNIAVFHRLSDLNEGNFSGGNSDSAKGLISDSETKIIFSQPTSELELLGKILKLNPMELSVLPKLTRAHALWKVSEKSFLIRHRISDFERLIVDTDQSLRSGLNSSLLVQQ